MSNLFEQGAQPQDNRTTFIYALVDPRTGYVRYVGKANDPKNRYSRHLAYYVLERGDRRTTSWIKELLAIDLKPTLKILDEVPFSGWQDFEKRWIAYFRAIPGYPELVNGTDGGGYTYRKAAPKGFKRRKETRKRGRHRHKVEQPSDPSYKIIPLTRGMNTNVSTCSYEFLSQWNWVATKPNKKGGWYAARNDYSTGRNHVVFMHAALLPHASRVDHISGDTLDNRLENLRPATAAQNAWNRKTPSTNKSGYKGVSWYAPTQKWLVKIYFGNEQFHLGLFTDPIEGARCYDRKAIELFGEYARTNFPVSEYAKEKPIMESSKVSRRTGRKKRNSTSRFTGVCYTRRDKRWLATIWYLGKQVRLGTFIIEEDAARAYDRFVIENGISDARTNFPRSSYE
jgi:hypothetical protein